MQYRRAERIELEMKSYLQLSILCTASFFVFLAYNSTQNLESTANEDVGTTAIGTLYVVIIVATGAAPKVVGFFELKHYFFLRSICRLTLLARNGRCSSALVRI